MTLGFVNHGDELVLAEVRIFPTREAPSDERVSKSWGEWSWDPDVVPLGGLTLRTIRKLTISEARKFALANVPRSDTGFVTASRLARAPQKPADQDLRRRPPEDLARVALLYERAVNERQHPNAVIYAELKNSLWPVERTSVPGLVRAARAAGYLTPATKGRASGRATTAAHALVNGG